MARSRFLAGGIMAAILAGAAGGAIASIPPAADGMTYAEMVYSGEADHRGYGSTTKLGTATGAYQFTFETLQDLGYVEKGQARPAFGDDPWNGIKWTGKGGVNSRAEFLASSSAQDEALGVFTERNWVSIQSKTPLEKDVNGVPMTQPGALYAAHMLGTGGYAQWASCDFQAHCISVEQASANNMTKEQMQEHLMGRLAKGAGVDPSTITGGGGSGGGMGGGTSTFENVAMKLMPWDSAAARVTMLPGDM